MSEENAAALRADARRRAAASPAATIGDFYPFWDAQVRPFLVGAVRALPVGRFGWKPQPRMLTAQQLVVHVAEAERAWIHQVVEGGSYEEWVVPHEDPERGWVTVIDAPDHQRLLALLETWHRPTQRLFARPASELSLVIANRRPDGSVREQTLHWILERVLEHEVHHRGQLVLYLRLMGIEPPPIM